MADSHTMLILDKDAYYAEIFAKRFEQAGWSVRAVSNVKAAKQSIEKQMPEVLIVDLHPPDEVLVFLKGLREQSEHENLLVLVLSDTGERELVQEASAAGVDHYLFKGDFPPSEAVKKVVRLLEEKTS